MARVIGIDLGTTNSAMAVLEGGEPMIIPNAEGERTTPSVVAFTEDGEVIVGRLAKQQAIANPERTITSIKRKMGTTYRVKIDDKEYTPQEISAFILRKLKHDAEEYLGEKITKAVITVPAYFEDPQRQATKDAGRIAGLDVLRIINEPTAAALAYGLDKMDQELTVLVFDLGGGTFDVSILEIGNGLFEVKATSGNNHLGGDDFDRRIMDWLIERFKEKHGVDLSQDRIAMQRLKDAAEKAKIELSTKLSTVISLPYIWVDETGPKHLEEELTRKRFEAMTEDLIEKTIGPTKRALKDAGLRPSDIDKILLVGGMTRMPAVQNFIREFFKKNPEKKINPDECVAIGAAIQGGVLTGEVKDVLLLDVTPLSLGVETVGGLTSKIIPRNTTIPTRKSQIFSTAEDNQTSVEIHVVQGERELAKDNKSLGKFTLVGIPPAPRGVPQIEVTFEIDADGILHVSAKDLATGKEQKIKIQPSSGITEEDVKRMIEEAERYAEEDKKKRKLIELKNQADALIYHTEKSIKELEDKLDKEKLREVKKIIKETRAAMEGTSTKKLKEAIDRLNDVAKDLFAGVWGRVAEEEYEPVTVKCPKCAKKFTVTNPTRPLKVTCPYCGATGTIRTPPKKKKVEKKVEEKEEKAPEKVAKEEKKEKVEKKPKKPKVEEKEEEIIAAPPPKRRYEEEEEEELYPGRRYEEEEEEYRPGRVRYEEEIRPEAGEEYVYGEKYEEAYGAEVAEYEEEEAPEREEEMAIVECPKCGAEIEVPVTGEVERIRCPECGTRGRVDTSLLMGEEEEEEEGEEYYPRRRRYEEEEYYPGRGRYEEEEEIEEEEEAKPTIVRCKKCGERFKVTSTKRPLKIRCPNCGAEGVLK